MKFIPYSNGFHKLNKNRQIKPTSVIKNIFLFVLVLVFIGFAYQIILNKIDSSKIEPDTKYVRIDSKKNYFKFQGESKPTIIMDSDLGLGISEWEKVQGLIEKEYGYRTFTYDRPGYGFSESIKGKSIKEQAQQLRMILKKVGIGGPYILVGEGYGGLVMCNFAELYPELVQGVILIDPISEEALNNKDYMKQFSDQKFSRFVQKYGSYFGLTSLMNKFGMLKNPIGLDSNLSEESLKTYDVLRTKSDYNSAYYSELTNILEQSSNSQKSGLLNGKPLSIIVNDNAFVAEQESLKKLTSEGKVQIIDAKNKTDVIPLEKPELLLESIKFIQDNSPEEQK